LSAAPFRRQDKHRAMTTFRCSACERNISGFSLLERKPMCRACRAARTDSSGRPPIAAVILAPVSAAVIAASCLAHGLHGPFAATNALANFAFWVVAGMAIALVVRLVVKGV
jgi:hypothetical protein